MTIKEEIINENIKVVDEYIVVKNMMSGIKIYISNNFLKLTFNIK